MLLSLSVVSCFFDNKKRETLRNYNEVKAKQLKSFRSHNGPQGGADLRFTQPDTSQSCKSTIRRQLNNALFRPQRNMLYISQLWDKVVDCWSSATKAMIFSLKCTMKRLAVGLPDLLAGFKRESPRRGECKEGGGTDVTDPTTAALLKYK